MAAREASGSSHPEPTSEQPTFNLLERKAKSQDRRFIEWIRDSHPKLYKKISASTDFKSLTLKEAFPVLLAELQQEDNSQRRIALQVICRSVESETPNPFVRNMPQDLQETVVRSVIEHLQDPDPRVCREAVDTLSGFFPRFATQISDRTRFLQDVGILKGLSAHGVNHPDAQIAKSSIALLGRMEINLRSAAVPALISALNHPNPAVRQAACVELRDLGEDSLDAIPELLRLLTSDDPTKVRVAAALALLAIYGHDSTVEQLRKKVTDLPSFLDFLRFGGDRLRALRLALQKPQPSTRKPASTTKPRVNARMMDEISRNANVRGFTSLQWAERLKCARSSVVATVAWKQLKDYRDTLAAERANDRRRRLKASEQQRD
jgi:HEAT repeat protein